MLLEKLQKLIRIRCLVGIIILGASLRLTAADDIYAVSLYDVSITPGYQYMIVCIEDVVYMQKAIFPGHLKREFWKLKSTKTLEELFQKTIELKSDLKPPFHPSSLPPLVISVIRKRGGDWESQYFRGKGRVYETINKIRAEIIKSKSKVLDLHDAPSCVKESMSLYE